MKKMLSCDRLVRKIAEKEITRAASLYAKGYLLDIGCGDKLKEKIFLPYVKKYVGLDHENSLHDLSKADILATAYNTTLLNESVNTILCTSVLEHLKEPSEAIKEANRILKKGGHAIYTMPLFWHLHEEPIDFYRYTKYGLRYLFEKNNFEIIELKPLSGFCVTFGQELVYYIWWFRKGGKVNPLWWIIPIVGMFIQIICYLLNKIDHSERFTWAYLVVVKKL
ncbi:MAG: class I SAM-dependent methyltransferase [Candidatus Andersenbacteria bacterium]|nr:class I SAM-dependent methyltransferase [Candidatus Andersenbacteria bacterium]